MTYSKGMGRPVRAASNTRATFPRVATAWRILAGLAPMAIAAPALADATVPPQPGPNDKKQVVPCPLQAGQQGNATSHDYPPMGGVIAVSHPPQPPTPVLKAKNAKDKKSQKATTTKASDADWLLGGVNLHVSNDRLLVHPHGPDEPCRRTRRG